MSITHAFSSAKSDGADSSVVQPSDWNAAHVIASGYSLVRSASQELDNDEIKALPSFPILIASAPGTGKAILLVQALYNGHLVADYMGVDAASYFYITAGNDPGLAVSNKAPCGDFNFLDAGGGDLIGYATPAVATYTGFSGVVDRLGYDISRLEDKALYLSAVNVSPDEPVNYTGGDAANTLTVTIYYLVVDL